MKTPFDEISLQYWRDNRIKTAAKSYSCLHNGFVYGDDMDYQDLSFINIDGDKEQIISATSPRKAYIKMVEAVCNESNKSFNNYRNQSANKYKLFSEDEVANFTKKQRRSTRILDENSSIIVNGAVFYVSNNLKVCEYFNALCSNVDEERLKNWLVRISFGETAFRTKTKSLDEIEEISSVSISDYVVTIVEQMSNSRVTEKEKTVIPVSSIKKHVDYLAEGKQKKETGDLGELIVFEYEKARLRKIGHEELADLVEHSSKVHGDGLGYDIKSFSSDGTELFIEVKSTKQDYQDNFQMSQNEVLVANKMFEEGKKYLIYRLYNIQPRTGKVDMMIFTPPFTEEKYCMTIDSYTISI